MEQPPQPEGLYQRREHEVSVENKQQLFVLACDLMLSGDSEAHDIVYPGKQFIDVNGLPAKYRILEMNAKTDERWQKLQRSGFSEIVLYYWPERTTNGTTYPDQINLQIDKLDKSPTDLYTMKMSSDESGFRVSIGNRREIHKAHLEWLEISRGDAETVKKILDAINEILHPGLAPQ